MKTLFFLIFLHISHIAVADTSVIDLNLPDEDALRLLNIYLDNTNLDEIVPAYQLKNNLVVPLGLVSDLLGIAIKVYPNKGYAEGFTLQENRQFYLDTLRNQITLLGKTKTYPEEKVVVLSDDIYVEVEQLMQWLPLKISVNLFAATIKMVPTEPFPLILRLERESRSKKIKGGRKAPERNYPEKKRIYKLWSSPFIDQTLSFRSIQEKDKATVGSYRYITHASADILFLESSLYLNGNGGNNNEINDYRILFGRKDPNTKLLGPLNASEFSFGHITSTQLKNVSRAEPSQGGLSLSNYPLKQQRNFDSHTFEGELLPNWQVELYHNNVLIDFLANPIDGLYRFVDVPLLFGNNYFRIVFYGPHGEEREETHNFIVNGLLTKPGQQYYRFNQSHDEKNGDKRLSLNYALGINKHFSLDFDYISIPVDDVQHEYVKTGISTFVESLFFNINWIKDENSGSATELDLQTKWSGLNVKLGYTEFDNFESELIPATTDPFISKTSIKFDGIIPESFFSAIPVTLQVDEDKRKSGKITTTWKNRFSFQINRYLIRNNLTQIIDEGTADRTRGSLSLSRHFRGDSIRASLNYRLQPESIMDSLKLDYTAHKIIGSYGLNLGTTYFSNDEQDYSFGLNKRKGNFSLSFDTLYNTKDRLTINLSISTSLGKNPMTSNWHFNSNSVADKGAIALLVFFDANNNGIQDKKEKGMSNVSFFVDGRRRAYKTDKDGHAFVSRVDVDESMDISVAIDSLEDPVWTPAVKGYRLIPRKGQVTQVIFPVIETGEIDGTTYVVQNGQKKPVSDVDIQLVDVLGKVVSREKSEYDGFYVFTDIVPGSYTIRVSPEQLERLGFMQPRDQKQIIVSSENLVINGIETLLYKK